MAVRQPMGANVFDKALDRMISVFEAGHRPVVSFSAGKDSTCALEITILAARLTGKLPVDVVLRDEEINFPGTYEYAQRTAQRPEVRFHWLVANQPILNCFNRKDPYIWVFDPQLPPEQWVRQPPINDPLCNVTFVKELNIEHMTIPSRFPPDPGKSLCAVIGLRTDESMGRLYGLFSSGGYMTKANKHLVRNVRPIYDWTDGDVWKAIGDNKWDYNKCYDTLMAMGVPRRKLRVAPPTMNAPALNLLQLAAKAWPDWFERVADRCAGARTAVMFGARSVSPERLFGETWEECFQRHCVDDAPAWIRARAEEMRTKILHTHSGHATVPLPETKPCRQCFGNLGSWRKLTQVMYSGDPFSVRCPLSYVEPEFFRPGAGTWGGKASF